jgi:hypothetical protein
VCTVRVHGLWPVQRCPLWLEFFLRPWTYWSTLWSNEVGPQFQLSFRRSLMNVILYIRRCSRKYVHSNTKSLAYTSLVRPILEYGAACWDPYREGQINALDRVQKKVAKFAHHRNESNWGTLTEPAYMLSSKRTRVSWAWKAVGERLQTPSYQSWGDHGKKVMIRKQWTDIGKYLLCK